MYYYPFNFFKEIKSFSALSISIWGLSRCLTVHYWESCCYPTTNVCFEIFMSNLSQEKSKTTYHIKSVCLNIHLYPGEYLFSFLVLNPRYIFFLFAPLNDLRKGFISLLSVSGWVGVNPSTGWRVHGARRDWTKRSPPLNSIIVFSSVHKYYLLKKIRNLNVWHKLHNMGLKICN